MARREWGSGSIYPAGGRWRASINLGTDHAGRRIRREWQRASKEAAELKLDAVQRRLRGGLSAEESRVTLAVYAEEWLDAVRPPTVRPSTFSFYATLVRVHLVEHMGHLTLVRIGPSDVRRLISVRLGEGYAPRTVRGIVDVLRMILKQAVGDGIVGRNVAELVALPKLEQAEPKHFTAEQARRFLDVASTDDLGSFFAVALGTGLRRGELLELTWRDVDNGSVTVRRSKTGAGVRTVPIPDFAAAALTRVPRTPGPIWPVSPWVVSRRMAALCDAAGLPRLGLHGLRHSTASLLFAEGVPDFVVQSILGHSRVGMTRHYTHIEIEQQRDAMERLGRAIR